VKAAFIEPMLLLPTTKLPDDPGRFAYELKLDGYRAVAYKTGGRVFLRSRNNKDFNARYPGVVNGLAGLPDDTVIDGEVVALDPAGKPSFSLLAHAGTGATVSAPILYYVFDAMMVAGRSIVREPLSVRQEILQEEVLPTLIEPVRHAAPLDAPLPVLIKSVKAHGFEGLVGKRLDSPYEPGLRSGKWQKMRVNQDQTFVIGGYTLGASTFDALIVGVYDGDRLIYVARTRSGFTPAIRAQLMKRFRGLETAECPFVNLPELKPGRWGVGLTKEKMAQCRWLKPQLVAQVEFVEWTDGDHLRHTKFVRLVEDADPKGSTRPVL
jgi:DNA ligase D-like protein (predicted ligase)